MTWIIGLIEQLLCACRSCEWWRWNSLKEQSATSQYWTAVTALYLKLSSTPRQRWATVAQNDKIADVYFFLKIICDIIF